MLKRCVVGSNQNQTEEGEELSVKRLLRKLLESRDNGTSNARNDGIPGQMGYEQWLHMKFASCHDVIIEKLALEEQNGTAAIIVYCIGMVDIARLNEAIIPRLRSQLKAGGGPAEYEGVPAERRLLSFHVNELGEQVADKVFQGELLVFIEASERFYSLNAAKLPQRRPEEANTEISIRGPRDGFVEELITNVALVRKRLRTDSLSFEQFTVGERGKSKVGLLYIKDIIDPQVLQEVKERISDIHIDAVYSSNEMEELLSDSPFSLFPMFDYTGRPDYVVSVLLRGRFAVLVDGAPTAIIAPANLSLLFKTPEDLHNSYSYVAFARLFRLVGLFISLFLPGIYIAIATYHQDQVPLTLLATMVVSRKGVPFPTPAEAIIMLFLFELFREAGIRLPNSIGQTLAVVGGIIIGSAAISAGLTSASMLVVMGTTAVATYTLVNQSLVGAVSILRLLILLASSFLGIFGSILSIFAVLVFLVNLRSFGVSYLQPLSPLQAQDLVHALLRLPANKLKKRPQMLHPTDSSRQGEDS